MTVLNRPTLPAVETATAFDMEFLPVGENSKSGDAIVTAYMTPAGQKLMVVDGGDLAAGDRAVAFIEKHYGSNAVIEHMVCTHSDGDHASGLRRIIERFTVKNLWVHQPWKYASTLNPKFKGNWADLNLANHLRNDCFPIVAELCDLAETRGVALREPFAGAAIGPFCVLAPSYDRLLDLVPQMDQTPSQKSIVDEALRLVRRAAQSVMSIFESWDIETLTDPDENSTSVPNETSVVLFAEMAGRRILLTADAGIGALTEAFEVASHLGIPVHSPDHVQIPHHGSRHNVGPKLLNALLGPKLDSEGVRRGSATASASKESEKHPYRVVLNAFKRRGYSCHVTRGNGLRWQVGYGSRPDYGPAPQEPFHDIVEE